VAHHLPFVVGLTGGIGSGKSTAASCFSQHGAVVIDADQISRALTAAGSVVLDEITDSFGSGLVDSDGALDRAALASIVFSDPDSLARLNAIMHPKIRAKALEKICASDPHAIVVYDMPLLVETGSEDICDAVVVIDVDPRTQVERLVASRGMSVEQAEERIRNQASREFRNKSGTWIIENSSSHDDFVVACEIVWKEIEQRAHRVRE